MTMAALAAATSLHAVAEDAPKKSWETSAGANLGLTSGNSETFTAGLSIISVRKWDKNELSLNADVNYGENTTKSVAAGPPPSLVETKSTTTQNYGAGLQYNRLVWQDRGYVLGKVDGREDKIAGVDYRLSLNPGVGYYLLRDKQYELSGEVGPGFVFEKLHGRSAESYVTLRVGEKFKWNISEHARLFQDAEFLPRVEDFGDYVANASIKLEADLTKSMAMNIMVRDTYRSRPADFAPGIARKKNDVQLTAGISYKF
jgi:putative salt-induced outer membrane protein YdiY